MKSETVIKYINQWAKFLEIEAPNIRVHDDITGMARYRNNEIIVFRNTMYRGALKHVFMYYLQDLKRMKLDESLTKRLCCQHWRNIKRWFEETPIMENPPKYYSYFKDGIFQGNVSEEEMQEIMV